MNDVSSLPVVSKYPAEASPKDMTRERTMSPGLRDGEELCKDTVVCAAVLRSRSEPRFFSWSRSRFKILSGAGADILGRLRLLFLASENLTI